VRQEGVTTFILLLAAFQVLFYRTTGQTDIVIGTDSANRHMLETEKIIGFFVNLLALRTDLRGKPTFRAVLKRVREVVVGAYAHQDTPFELLVEKLATDHYLDRSPIVQVLFVLQNIPLQIEQSVELEQQGQHTIGNPLSSASPLDRETLVKFDLALFMWERDGKLAGVLNYRLDLFKASTIATMMARFITLLQSCVEQPDMPIDFLNMIVKDKKEQNGQEKQKRRKVMSIHDDGLFALPGPGFAEHDKNR
jgi:non-ribosomal peptide synthetase component F